MKVCAFCDRPEDERKVVLRNELAWAFPTHTPIVPGHLLICPVRCVETIDELTSEELTALFELRAKLKSALQKTFGTIGFNYAWNEGSEAGQSVPHVHLHMIPRTEGDAEIYEYEPRQFLYRPGSRNITPTNELNEIAELIQKNLA